MANNFEELISFKKLQKSAIYNFIMNSATLSISGLHLESTCNSILG